MSKKQVRVRTKQPGVYKNTSTKKYDVKMCMTVIDPRTAKKKYLQKWKYGIKSYTEAVRTLREMKEEKQNTYVRVKTDSDDIDLKHALDLWLKKAKANMYSPVSIGNTRQQYNMITKFWSPEMPLIAITEDQYLDLIYDCREYGYAEETIWNINACLKKLINIAYKNHRIEAKPTDFWDSPRIQTGAKRNVIPYKDYERLCKFFGENEFIRLGEDHYPKYLFMFILLYGTGMRIGEALALKYSDFESCNRGPVKCEVSVTKAYNSAYKFLKGTKNYKTRRIPISETVIAAYERIKKEHMAKGGKSSDKIFPCDHSACNSILKKACVIMGLDTYSCHDFRHTYISNLIRQGVPLPVIEAVSGDTQETILKHYSHMFAGDEAMVLMALECAK